MPRTQVEFYDRATGRLLASVDRVGAVPRVDDLVNIKRKTWRVKFLSWCVDQPTGEEPTLRCNLNLERAPEHDP